ncbi:MAG: DEAD/DEAH box helicase family protein [Verrucomicrobiales bacterium]|nr:DEAD/DEAH box helicase family protein [Verrucomicrobiales bacterium]
MPMLHHSTTTPSVPPGNECSDCVMTSQNFEFLRSRHRELADLGGFAERYVFSDPSSCLVKLRTFAEAMVKALFAHHRFEATYQSNLNDLLADPSFKSVTPAVVQDKLHLLRIKGNHAAHGTLYVLSDAQLLDVLREAHALARWFSISVDGGRLEQLPAFVPPNPEAEESKAELKREKKAVLQKLAEQEALMAKLLDDLEKARAKAEAAEKSEEEKRILLTQAQQAANALDFSEEETRFKLIDEQLRAAGWDVGPRGSTTGEVGQEIKVLHQPTNSGEGRADYVLYAENGKPLAVIECKKTAEDSVRGKMQARYYADGLENMHGVRPVIFYTNGYEIYIWNDAKGEPPRPLFGFYSRDSLEYEHFQTREREAVLGALHPRESIVDRLYQVEAVKRVSERFDQPRRKALLIQATGTGKTRVAIALCELMVRAKWAKRILFLCDRRELRKQAGDTFDEHLPDEPRVFVSSRTSEDRNKRIYLATYPAMMKCYQNFDVGFFDLIIADESHRSIYNRYRDLFRYFDAYQVGLTATPLKFVFRNTYKLFDCENEDPTFNYTYEEAINHDPSYLCPFRVIKHTTKFLREGIKYKNLPKWQQEELDDQFDDAESIDYTREQVSKLVFNTDTDLRILRNLMENGIRNGEGSRIGKTIIFARNHQHAKLLVELFDKEFPQYGGDFCARIDNYEPRAEQLIDDFKSTDGSKNLTIAVSVDMLDTGIDVPSIVNLVFAKPVKSYAKFWQMTGRGTRLCKNLFGPGRDKEVFQIFDHWGNFEYFDELRNEEEPSRSKSLAEQLFEARLQLGETAVAKQDLDTLHLATRLLAADVAALPADCLCVREKWREVRSVQREGVIDSFDPATVAMLRREILPLMQWRDARGREAALKFDLLVAKLQEARLSGSSSADDLRDRLIEEVTSLPINLKPVAERIDTIQQAKSLTYHQTATAADLESMRTGLRGIMHNRRKTIYDPVGPRILTVREDDSDVEYGTHKVKLEGLDLAAYRSRVESVLRGLLEQSEALRKIRAGQPVASVDIETLVDDVLIHDPDLHLEELLVHYPNKSKSLEMAIRRVIGLDSERVDAHFRVFVQRYPALNANQIRFLDLLKSYLSRYGAIELEKLWEAPFTTIDSAGIDGVFKDSGQIDAILELLQEFNEPTV